MEGATGRNCSGEPSFPRSGSPLPRKGRERLSTVLEGPLPPPAVYALNGRSTQVSLIGLIEQKIEYPRGQLDLAPRRCSPYLSPPGRAAADQRLAVGNCVQVCMYVPLARIHQSGISPDGYFGNVTRAPQRGSPRGFRKLGCAISKMRVGATFAAIAGDSIRRFSYLINFDDQTN